MPPAITPGAEVRGPCTPIGRECRWNLTDFQAHQARFHHHFTCEFHASRPQFQTHDCVLAEGTNSTVKVPNRNTEECPPQSTEDRIAKIAVQRRHCPRLD